MGVIIISDAVDFYQLMHYAEMEGVKIKAIDGFYDGVDIKSMFSQMIEKV